MGTFRLDFEFFSSTGSFGSEIAAVGYLGLADYYVGLSTPGAPTALVNARIDYVPKFTNPLSLDGGSFGKIEALPLGFCFPVETLGTLKPPTLSNYPGYAQQRTAVGVLNDYARVKVDHNGASNTTQVTGTGLANGPIDLGASPPTILLNYVIDLFLGPQITITISGVNQWTALAFQLLRLSGNYITVSWSWQISNGLNFNLPGVTPTQVGEYFGPEAIFAVSSGGSGSNGSGSLGDLSNIFGANNPAGTGVDLLGTLDAGSGNGISAVEFAWQDSVLGPQTVTVLNTDFEEWTWIYFRFNLPSTLPTGKLITVSLKSAGFPAIPEPTGTGIIFSGSVKLGTIKILGTEASGIYTLVTDRTHDTFYINSPVDNTTANFAIPDPSAKTGFIGG